MIKPISPKEITKSIPDGVIESFNELIQEHWSGKSASVNQDDAVDRILKKIPGIDRRKIFKKGWLDVESLFENEGWKVTYDKPDFNETYKAFFVFEVK